MSNPLLNISYSRNKNFPWQTIDSETIIIDPKGQNSFELNDVGSLAWNLMNGENTGNDILIQICDFYEVDREDAKMDLEQWLQDMQSNDLISGRE